MGRKREKKDTPKANKQKHDEESWHFYSINRFSSLSTGGMCICTEEKSKRNTIKK